MAAEPSEEDINNFTGITGVFRDQALGFLKVGISLRPAVTVR
jgi:hypothetical protein